MHSTNISNNIIPKNTSNTVINPSFTKSSTSSGGGVSTRNCPRPKPPTVDGVGGFDLNLKAVIGGGEKDYIYLNTNGICLLCYDECTPITIEEKRRVHLQTSINFCRLISRYLDFSLEEVITSQLRNVGKRWGAGGQLLGSSSRENCNTRKYDKVAFELCERCVNLAHAFNQVFFQVQFHQLILDRCVRSISEIIKNANRKSVNELFVLSEDDEAIRTQQKTFTRLTLGGLRSANRLRTKLYKKGLAKLSKSFPILKLKKISRDLISQKKIKITQAGGKINRIFEQSSGLLAIPSSPQLLDFNSKDKLVLASYLGCIVSFWIVISLSFINLDELVINIKKEREIELKLERDIGMDVDFKLQVPHQHPLPPPPPPVYLPPKGSATATTEPKKKRTYKKKTKDVQAEEVGGEQPKKKQKTSKAKPKYEVVVFPTPLTPVSSVSPSPLTPTTPSLPQLSPQAIKKSDTAKGKKEKGEKKPKKEKTEKKTPAKPRKPKVPPVQNNTSMNNTPTTSTGNNVSLPPFHPHQGEGYQIQQQTHQQPMLPSMPPSTIAFSIQSLPSPKLKPLTTQAVIGQQGETPKQHFSSSIPSVIHPTSSQYQQMSHQLHQISHQPVHQTTSVHQQPPPSATQFQTPHQYNYTPMSNQSQYLPAQPPQSQHQQYYSAAPAPVPSSTAYQSNSHHHQQQQQQHSYYQPVPTNNSELTPSNSINSQPQVPQNSQQMHYNNGTVNYNTDNPLSNSNVNLGGSNYNYSYNVTSYNYSNNTTGVTSASSSTAASTSTWIPNFPTGNEPNNTNSSSYSSTVPPLQTSTYSFSSISGSGAVPATDQLQGSSINYNNYDTYSGTIANAPAQDVNVSSNPMATTGGFNHTATNGVANRNAPINTAIYAYDGYGNYVLQHQETSYPMPPYSSEPASVSLGNSSEMSQGQSSTSTAQSSYFSSLLAPIADVGMDDPTVLSSFNSAIDLELNSAFNAVDEPAPSLTYEEPPPQFYDLEVEQQEFNKGEAKTSDTTVDGEKGDSDGESTGGSKLKSISIFPEVHWRQQQTNATSLKISCTHTGCTEQFITHAQLQLHLRAHGNFKCNVCHMSFGKAHNLALHEKAKHGKKGKCPRCDHHLTPSTFKYLLHFIGDHLNISVNDKPCEICLKPFLFGTKAINRKLHFKKYHDVQGKDPTTISTCKGCNAQFIKETQLKDHQSYCNTSSSASGSEARNTPSTSSTQSTTAEEITYNTALATAEQVVS